MIEKAACLSPQEMEYPEFSEMLQWKPRRKILKSIRKTSEEVYI